MLYEPSPSRAGCLVRSDPSQGLGARLAGAGRPAPWGKMKRRRRKVLAVTGCGASPAPGSGMRFDCSLSREWPVVNEVYLGACPESVLTHRIE